MEVKGCCFKHTAMTEQFMSDHVGKVIGVEGIVVGNRPRGMWKYSLPEEPLPKVRGEGRKEKRERRRGGKMRKGGGEGREEER